jgi:bacteriorhodopsin
MTNVSVYSSLILSILIQLITGIIQIGSLFLKVPASFLFLKELMVLDVIVQIIEGSFYTYWLYNFKNITNITPKRYVDWALTTPTMLITLIFYLIFLNRGTTSDLNFFELFNKEFYTIVTVLLLNWLMLLFGYLAEIKLIPLLLGVALGFFPFLIYYYIIYKKYVSENGLNLFYYFVICWSLYGVIAVLPYKIKNICYNILDLFAKNFFGMFLSYILYINSI